MVAIRGYRSLREVIVPLGRLSIVTGANGAGKSSLYRALRLLADCGRGEVIGSLAPEGGLQSVLWAGPEQLGGARRTGKAQGTVRTRPVSLEMGFAADDTADGGDQIRVRPRPRDQAGSGVRRPGAAHRHDAGAPDPRFRRGERRIGPGLRRVEPVGTRTPVLSDDGHDLAAAIQTIIEAGFDDLARTVADAFDGATVSVAVHDGVFDLQLKQRGMLRPLRAAELSYGTLRFLLWAAALLSPQAPSLMVPHCGAGSGPSRQIKTPATRLGCEVTSATRVSARVGTLCARLTATTPWGAMHHGGLSLGGGQNEPPSRQRTT
jgi:predicted ATPase